MESIKTLYNKGYSGLGQTGIYILMTGVGLVAGSLAALGIWLMLTGRGMNSMVTDMLDPRFANPIKWVQGISTLFMFFLPMLGFAFICFRNGWLALGFNGSVSLKVVAIALLILIASSPLIDAMSTINKMIPLSDGMQAWADKLEKSYEEQVKAIATLRSFQDYLLSFFMIAVLPALFEEVFFRGGMQNLLHRWWQNPIAAIIVTSIIFSAIHVSWFGFLPRIVLGIVLGLVFYYTQNLWYCVIIHALNNGIIVTYMYYLSINGKPVTESSETTFPAWTGIISLALLVFLLRLLKKQPHAPRPKEVMITNDPFGGLPGSSNDENKGIISTGYNN